MTGPCDRCGVAIDGADYCSNCRSCQYCMCCPCYKIGCEECPWDGRQENESKDEYIERVRKLNAEADHGEGYV